MSLIKEQLIKFICREIGGNDLDRTREEVVGTLDEIILNYVVTVLGEASKCREDFDLEEFCEMLGSYFPLFLGGRRESTHAFIQDLLTLLQPPTTSSTSPSSSFSLLSLLDTPTPPKPLPLPLQSSESPKKEQEKLNPALSILLEMFPSHSPSSLSLILSLTKDDLDRAVQIVLEEPNLTKAPKPKKGEKVEDPKNLKEKLMTRYGFIDKEEDEKEFRPLLHKEEPKKMVMWRGGLVVSTKGERFSEFNIDPATGEEVKIRSYLSKSQRVAQAEGKQF